MGAESPPRGCFPHTAILSWRTRMVTPNTDKKRLESQKGRSDLSSAFSLSVVQTPENEIRFDKTFKCKGRSER